MRTAAGFRPSKRWKLVKNQIVTSWKEESIDSKKCFMIRLTGTALEFSVPHYFWDSALSNVWNSFMMKKELRGLDQVRHMSRDRYRGSNPPHYLWESKDTLYSTDDTWVHEICNGSRSSALANALHAYADSGRNSSSWSMQRGWSKAATAVEKMISTPQQQFLLPKHQGQWWYIKYLVTKMTIC